MPVNSYDHRGPANDNLLDGVAQNMAAYLGLVPSPGSAATAKRYAMTSATSAIAATETLLLNAPIILPQTYLGSAVLGTLNPGTLIRATIMGTCTSSNADVSTFTLRAGILGTTSDASIATWVVTAAGSGSNIPFQVVINTTIRALATSGANGTAYGSMAVQNTGVTGIAGVTNTVVNSAAGITAFPTLTATFLDFTYVSAASTTACTFQQVIIEIFP